ncbi:MAG: hypothetical protein M3N68_13705 [Actinomycetota bacterium]|nr:hypothetical protein [Actinomycetota bacterium]
MIAGWLVKVLLGIAVFGLVAVELGSPAITRVQLDDVAHDVADEAAHELRAGNAHDAAAQAQRSVAERDAVLKEFSVDTQGLVHVTVGRQARSLLLSKWDRTDGWYDVEVSAASARRGA